MRSMLRICLPTIAVVLASCGVVPPLEPIVRKQKVDIPARQGIVQMPIGEALERYAPPDFKVSPTTVVDPSTIINFDTSLPWQKALARGLNELGIEVAAPTSISTQSVATPVAARPTDGVPATSPSAASTNPVRPTPVQPTTPAVAAPAAPAAESYPITEKVWEVRAGASLKKTLEQWCKSSGWDCSWNVKDEQTNEEKDFTLGGGMRTEGNFKDAVRELFAALPKSVKVKAELWSGNYPPLLYVFNEGEQK